MRTACTYVRWHPAAYRLACAVRVHEGSVHAAACRTHHFMVVGCADARQQQPGLAVSVKGAVTLRQKATALAWAYEQGHQQQRSPDASLSDWEEIAFGGHACVTW